MDGEEFILGIIGFILSCVLIYYAILFTFVILHFVFSLIVAYWEWAAIAFICGWILLSVGNWIGKLFAFFRRLMV